MVETERRTDLYQVYLDGFIFGRAFPRLNFLFPNPTELPSVDEVVAGAIGVLDSKTMLLRDRVEFEEYFARSVVN